jgi:hypothetical protein
MSDRIDQRANANRISRSARGGLSSMVSSQVYMPDSLRGSSPHRLEAHAAARGSTPAAAPARTEDGPHVAPHRTAHARPCTRTPRTALHRAHTRPRRETLDSTSTDVTTLMTPRLDSRNDWQGHKQALHSLQTDIVTSHTARTTEATREATTRLTASRTNIRLRFKVVGVSSDGAAERAQNPAAKAHGTRRSLLALKIHSITVTTTTRRAITLLHRLQALATASEFRAPDVPRGCTAARKAKRALIPREEPL